MNDFVSFPALNLKFDISDIIVQFRLFGIDFALRWYGLLIAVGFMLAVIYALRRAKHFEIDPDRMIDVTLVSALLAFVGARLYYVLFSSDISYYFEKPYRIFQVWEGGLAIYGGILFAFATAIWMCRVRKVNTLAMFDIASVGFLIGQGIGRWGNFFNQEAFGGNTTLPWGMTGSIIQQEGYNGTGYDGSLPVHPTFLYESLWCLIGFLILHFVSKKAYKFKGQIFSMYVMWYGLGRFMIEGLRTDSLMLGTMRVSQIVAALSVLGGAALFFVLRARHNSLPVDLFEEPVVDGETVEALDESSYEETDEEMADDNINNEVSDAEACEENTANESEKTLNADNVVADEEISIENDNTSVDDENLTTNSQSDNDEK